MGSIWSGDRKVLCRREHVFTVESDAGKVALTHLFEALFRDGFTLFDTQQLNEVTWNLGAYEIPKEVYLDRLLQGSGNTG